MVFFYRIMTQKSIPMGFIFFLCCCASKPASHGDKNGKKTKITHDGHRGVHHESGASVDLIPYQRALNVKTLQADMRQSDGTSISKGKIYIQRPGKLRIIYFPEKTLEIVSDGKKIVQYDWRTNQSHAMKVKDNPFEFLLGYFSFHTNPCLQICSVTKGTKETTIKVQHTKHRHSGHVILRFSECKGRAPFLSGWTICGAQGETIHVTLDNVIIDQPLHASVFGIRS